MVVKDPRLTRVDVRAVFDEVSEKFRVTGIRLRFDEQKDEGIRAIFEPWHELRSTVTHARFAVAGSRGSHPGSTEMCESDRSPGSSR